MSHKSAEELLAFLDEQRVTYSLFTHPPLHTVEDAIRERGDLGGSYIKNLYLRDRSGEMALVTCLNIREIDLQKLRHGIAYRRLSFASPDQLWSDLGVRPGSVSPLALINAKSDALKFYVDIALKDQELTNMHPLRNDRTVQLAWQDWVALCESWGFEIHWIDFEAL